MNDGLHKDLKVECAENDHTIKEVVNELVDGFLNGDIEVNLE